jgi:hypothetical protein
MLNHIDLFPGKKRERVVLKQSECPMRRLGATRTSTHARMHVPFRPIIFSRGRSKVCNFARKKIENNHKPSYISYHGLQNHHMHA